MIPIGRGQRELIIGDRQTGKTAVVARHDHQPEGQGRHLHLRRHRPEAGPGRAGRAHARSSTARWSTRSSSSPPRPTRPRSSTSRPSPACHGRGVHGERRQRADRLRRSLQARLGLSPGVAADAPPTGPRGVSRRRLLPPLAPAGARRAHERQPGRRLADGAADHRNAGRRRFGLHPDQRHLDHRRSDLSSKPTSSTPAFARR